jgi:CheY-like chemotaxis protein
MDMDMDIERIKQALVKRFSVLYVEDDENVRESLAVFLKRRFNTVYKGRDGGEGLELFRQYQPHLVITDIQMPVMNGLDMAAKIKLLSKNTPIIVTTAFNEVNYLTKSIDLGIDKYIKKPIVKDELLDAVYQCTVASIQRGELDEKDRVIRTIMDLNSQFVVITDNGGVGYINRTLLGFLGFSDMDEFFVYQKNFGEFFKDIGSAPNFVLKNKGAQRSIDCRLERHHFERTGASLFIFHPGGD